jgi:hypothetical protein
MSTIDQFRAQLSGGGARPSQFRVILTFPDWAGGQLASVKGNFLVKAASLPASTINPIEVPYRGRVTKVAGERQFANWNVTVLNDNDFFIRNALERWSKGIADHSSTSGRLVSSSYQTQMLVQQLDRNDLPVKTYQFYNCFPVNIGEIALDFGATSQIEEFPVEFSVDYWESVGGL